MIRHVLFLLLITVSAKAAFPPFQPLIDAAKPGETLFPSAGTYAGPVTIKVPLIIDGSHGVTIDGGGQGSVVLIETDGAQIRNLHLTHSGDSYDGIDACVQVRGNFNIIKDNRLDDCLFGIDLQQADHNILRRNQIRSKPFNLGLRGDAIRLWYSMNNKVTDNDISDSRDTVVWYSKGNLIARNTAKRGRYALHFMYSQSNRVEANHYQDNSVGIFIMYSDDVEVKNNELFHSLGTTGMGIGFKESSNVTVENNRIIYCSTGIYLDISPFQPDTVNQFIGNEVAYNGVGVLFHNDWQGNIFKNNAFKGNYTQVAVQGAMTARRNIWQNNFWDDYIGFDRNQDGIGDTPYESYAYADRLWMDVPSAQFFKGTLLLELLDFLERLAPFSDPILVLQDSLPQIKTKSYE